MRYLFTMISICYISFLILLMFIFSVNEYSYLLEEYPEEFENLCHLPLNNIDPQEASFFSLIFFIPLLIPFFILKKKGKVLLIISTLLLLALWYYLYIFRFIDC